jgi:hypothetical protein
VHLGLDGGGGRIQQQWTAGWGNTRSSRSSRSAHTRSCSTTPFASRAADHDVPLELQVWPEVPHVFQGFAALLADADRALLAAAAFIKRDCSLDTQADGSPSP